MSDANFWQAFGTLTMAVLLVVIIYRLLDQLTDWPAKWVARKLVNWQERGHPKWDGTFTTYSTIEINGTIIKPGTYRASGNLDIELPTRPAEGRDMSDYTYSGSGGDNRP